MHPSVIRDRYMHDRTFKDLIPAPIINKPPDLRFRRRNDRVINSDIPSYAFRFCTVLPFELREDGTWSFVLMNRIGIFLSSRFLQTTVG